MHNVRPFATNQSRKAKDIQYGAQRIHAPPVERIVDYANARGLYGGSQFANPGCNDHLESARHRSTRKRKSM
jgi:hypothetical protein